LQKSFTEMNHLWNYTEELSKNCQSF
jgi:hypothetical protein